MKRLIFDLTKIPFLKRLVGRSRLIVEVIFDLTKMPFLKRLAGRSRLIVEVLDDQNLFTESNLANWFSSYVQFCSGGHFSERAEAAR